MGPEGVNILYEQEKLEFNYSFHSKHWFWKHFPIFLICLNLTTYAMNLGVAILDPTCEPPCISSINLGFGLTIFSSTLSLAHFWPDWLMGQIQVEPIHIAQLETQPINAHAS